MARGKKKKNHCVPMLQILFMCQQGLINTVNVKIHMSLSLNITMPHEYFSSKISQHTHMHQTWIHTTKKKTVMCEFSGDTSFFPLNKKVVVD